MASTTLFDSLSSSIDTAYGTYYVNTGTGNGQSFFTTATAVTVTSVTFSAYNATGAAGTLTAAIYAYTATGPGAFVGSLGSKDNSTLSTASSGQVTFTFDLALSASTQYYVVLQDTATNAVIWNYAPTPDPTPVTGGTGTSYIFSTGSGAGTPTATSAGGEWLVKVVGSDAPVNRAPTANSDAISATEAGGTNNGTVGVNPSFNVITGTNGATADSDPDQNDTLTVQGVAAGTSQAALTTGTASDITGTYGTIHINADGGATYTVNNSNATVQGLASFANTLTDTFSYTIKDAGGLTSTTQVVVTIHGQNDAPSATNLTQTLGYTEDAGNAALNDIVVTDPDTGDTITARLTLGNAAAGALTTGTFGNATSSYNATTGAWTVSGSVSDVNAALAAVAFAPATDFNQNVTITTHVQDAAGSGPADGTITLNGTATNDPPSATDLSDAVAQRAGTSGNIIADAPVTDPDSTPTISNIAFGTTSTAVANGTVIVGAHGSLTVSSDGSYSYTANVEGGVAVGETVTDTFRYTASDGTDTAQANLTVSVTGSGQGDSGDNVFLLTGSGHSATGLGGNDTYLVDGLDDQVVEAANGGTDTVKATIDYTLGDNIERLVLAGRGNIDGTGNAAVNIVKGNVGDNYLDGGDGRDTLIGYGGNDTFVFSVAPGTNTVDRITDFNLNDPTHADTIALNTSVFTGLTFGNDGSLVGSQFASVVAGQKYGADVHIVYRSDKGALYYDADGYGGAGAVLFASLDGAPAVQASDIVKFDMLHA